MALFTPEVTWHEYSNGIGSEFFASPPDAVYCNAYVRSAGGSNWHFLEVMLTMLFFMMLHRHRFSSDKSQPKWASMDHWAKTWCFFIYPNFFEKWLESVGVDNVPFWFHIQEFLQEIHASLVPFLRSTNDVCENWLISDIQVNAKPVKICTLSSKIP